MIYHTPVGGLNLMAIATHYWLHFTFYIITYHTCSEQRANFKKITQILNKDRLS